MADRLMLDEFSVLALVTAGLEGAGIGYMVTGSVALSLYAEPRMTRDVDLVVELHPTDTERLVAMFAAEFICDADRIRDAIVRRAMFNLIHTAAVVKVDMIVRKDTAYREEEFRRRDVRKVIAAQQALDWRYLDLWAGRLGLVDLLNEARR